MSEINRGSDEANNTYAASRYPSSFYGSQGRLIYVDSALEAIKRGSTTVGIKTPEFAVISSHIKPIQPLIEPAEKVFTVDTHIGATGSGYLADILQLIDKLQVEAQRHRLTFESSIDVRTLAKQLGSFLHSYTIYAVRPQAASVIIAGVDEMGVQLYQVDPSGTFFRGSGFAIGEASDRAIDLIQKKYSKNMSKEDAIKLASDAIENAIGEKPVVEVGIITASEKVFKKI